MQRGSLKIKLDSNKALIVGCLTIICLLVARDLYNYSYNKYLIVGTVLLVLPFLNMTDFYSFFLFFVPMSCGIPGKYIFVLFAIFYFIKTRKTEISIYPFIIIMMEIILNIYCGYFFGSITTIVSYCSAIFLTFTLCLETNNEGTDYSKIAKYFFVGASVMLFIVFFLTLNTYSIDRLLSGSFRIGFTKVQDYDGMRFSTNSNTVGFYALLTTCIALWLLSAKKCKRKILLSAIAIADCLIGLFSVSRTYMLLLALVILLFVFGNFKNDYKKIAGAIGTCAFFIIAFIILRNNTTILDSYFSRFSAGSTSSGRMDIIQYYFDWQFSHPIRLLFGTGAIHYRDVVGFETSTHNGFQQVLVSYGVFGFVVFMIGLIKAFVISKNNSKISLIDIMPLICLLVFVQSVQFINPYEYFMSISVCYSIIKSATQNNTDEGSTI